MSSAASSQAPVTAAPATTAEPSPTPSPTSAAPVSTSAAPATTAPTTAAPSNTSDSVINSSSSSIPSSAATSSTASVASSSVVSTRTSSSPASASSRASLTSSISFIVQTSNGQVFTQTSVITVPAFTPQETQGNQSSGFFHNTGAVAGVFSVVGIVALVAIFFLLTSLVRRRRARKLDREIDEAAAAAANAQAPDFDDFDYNSGTGVGYGPYSETSHGTYNQPPLSHERSRNNLGDIPPTFDPYTGAGGPGPGAAGIGARGRSLRGGGMQDPFGALANPPEQYEMNEARRSWNQGTLRGGTEVTTYDLLQAAGLSGSDPYAVTRGASTRLAHTPSQSGVSALMRNQSQAGSSSLPTTAENYPIPTPAPAYAGGQERPYPPEKARYSGYSTMPTGGEMDVYGGYQDQPSAQLDNPHSPSVQGPRTGEGEHEEEYESGPYRIGPDDPARASLADDEDYGYNIGNRVLRVANE